MTDLKSTAGVTADEVLAYVAENYVSIEHLAAQMQVSAERILGLPRERTSPGAPRERER